MKSGLFGFIGMIMEQWGGLPPPTAVDPDELVDPPVDPDELVDPPVDPELPHDPDPDPDPDQDPDPDPELPTVDTFLVFRFGGNPYSSPLGTSVLFTFGSTPYTPPPSKES